MKKHSLLFLVLLVLTCIPLFAVSVHDVQYTTSAGDGTYPSPLNGQVVTLTNVVVIAKGYSGSNYTSDRWFVSDPEGGPWSGLYVYDTANAGSILVGDMINVTGAISEYYGLTELSGITSLEIVSHGNTIPAPISVNTGIFTQAAQVEQYEACLVQVQNVRVTSAPSATYFEWYVTDNSGNAQIDDGFIVGNVGLTPTPYVNETFVRIRGIVDYGHNEYAINPRFLTDIVQTITVATAQISIPQITGEVNTDIDIPVITSTLDPAFNIKRFSFDLTYDPIRLEILAGSYENTIIEGHEEVTLTMEQDSIYANVLHISFQSADSLVSADEDTLLILKARAKTYGESPLAISHFMYNTTTLNNANLTSGSVNIPARRKVAYLNIYNSSYSSETNFKLNHFNPREGKIRIDFGGNSNGAQTVASYKAFLRIYDSQGRLMATLVNEIINTPTGISHVEWDGRNSEGNIVPIGLYYCHLEVIDRVTGNKLTAVQPIVVGTQLKSK